MSELTSASLDDHAVTSVDDRAVWTSTEQRSSRSMFSMYSMALRRISTFGSRCVGLVDSQARCFSASNAMFTCN